MSHTNRETQKRIAEARALLFGNEDAPTTAPSPRGTAVANPGAAGDMLYKRFGNATETQILQRLLETNKDAETIEFWQQVSPSRIKAIQAAVDHVVDERRKRLRIMQIEKELNELRQKELNT